ncbi:hypothetical protein K469DRAFT_233337 [Zopfia rhizophila CBS 207.26]|uniref:Uncharacterized protein n=1 Tax=Zopfia rhizophila CBS 207.26 TaxID=1314779 RepID=A0A6A6DS35_9PEZI|nr:hypothetical protein K469DRAFT_233337 [Zopfia rhizophila CBS 207.26]
MCFVDENRGDRQETIVRRRSSGEDQQEDHQESSVYKQWSYLRGQHSVTALPASPSRSPPNACCSTCSPSPNRSRDLHKHLLLTLMRLRLTSPADAAADSHLSSRTMNTN